MVQVLKKSVDFVSVHKRIIMILGLFLLTFVVVPQVVEAQSALKISSLSDVESKAQEGSDTILNIAKYVLAAVLGIALVFVIYSLATNNPHAKEYLLGISALRDTYINVYYPQDKSNPLYTGSIAAGDKKEFKYKTPLKIMTTDAQNIEVYRNGKKIDLSRGTGIQPSGICEFSVSARD